MAMHDVAYLNLVQDILHNGFKREDRTGTGTIGVFSREMRFDVRDGSIPLLTTKKMGFKTIVRELLWFLSGDTNNNVLNSKKVTIWDEWAGPEGSLGPVYGQMWRNFPTPSKWVAVKSRPAPAFSADYVCITSSHEAIKAWAVAGNVLNDVEITEPKAKLVAHIAQRIWGYLRECYSITHDEEYQLSVPRALADPTTIDADAVVELFKNVPGYDAFINDWPTWHEVGSRRRIGNWMLQGDYFNDQTAILDPSLCAFVPRNNIDNSLFHFNPSQGRVTYTVHGPQFTRYKYYDRPSLMEGMPLPDGMLVRYPISGRDQITEVIHAIRTNPESRRLIVTGWNPTLAPVSGRDPIENVYDGYQALPPCHAFMQFYVEDKQWLSLKLTQRSADTMLGVPYNISQYTMLLHIVAHLTGLKAKEFIWSGGDVHVYSNHVDGANLQLTRTPKPSPRFIINEKADNITDFRDLTEDMFEIEGYNPDPAISFDVAY